MFRYRFLALLILLLLLLVAMPLVSLSERPVLIRCVISGLFIAVILSAVFAVSPRRVTGIVAWVLAALAIIAQIADSLNTNTFLSVARHVLSIAVIGYTVVLMLQYLFSKKRVTPNMIYASLCAYLLMGVLWAVIYSFIDVLQPGAFAGAVGDAANGMEMRFGTGVSVGPIYYSLVTLTTLGYGDIVPATASARMFSAIEAVFGQLYIAVLVARLVGLHISQSQRDD